MNQLKTPAIGFLLLCFSLAACNKKSGPKEVSATFIKQLYAMNFDDATASATDATKAIIQKNKKDLQENGSYDAERAKRTEAAAETNFSTKTLTEKISGNEADVSNDAVSVHLKLEDGKWKVAADEGVVDAILYRETYRANAKAAWEDLQNAYKERAQIVKDYLSYRSSTSGMTKETQTLSDAFAITTSTTADHITYIRNQDRLTDLLEKNVLPTLTAGSDITLNYIVQLSTARNHIAAAKKAYNEAAMKARAKDLPPVPEK